MAPRSRHPPRRCGRVAAAFVAAMIATAPTARADWRYTRWGMSPEEVTAASGGKARTILDPYVRGRSHVLLRAPSRMGPHRFDASFDFEDGRRLMAVYLDARNLRACPAIMAGVRARYGRRRAPTGDDTFRVERSNALVSLLSYPGHCSVIYQRLDPAGSEGPPI